VGAVHCIKNGSQGDPNFTPANSPTTDIEQIHFIRLRFWSAIFRKADIATCPMVGNPSDRRFNDLHRVMIGNVTFPSFKNPAIWLRPPTSFVEFRRFQQPALNTTLTFSPTHTICTNAGTRLYGILRMMLAPRLKFGCGLMIV
jgi:hypothetical protein